MSFPGIGSRLGSGAGTIMQRDGEGVTAVEPLVPYRLSICGLDELAGFADAGVSHVLSILDPDWPAPAALGAYGPHHHVVRRFHDVADTAPDVDPPAAADVDAILAWSEVLRAERAAHVLVHCHAGISRSTAAAVILLARDHPGREAEAFETVARLRPRSWPNRRLLAIADHRLGREGALVAALRTHQRRVAAAHPEFADLVDGVDHAHHAVASP
jgi:predicted protein tyrosine phosphatase